MLSTFFQSEPLLSLFYKNKNSSHLYNSSFPAQNNSGQTEKSTVVRKGNYRRNIIYNESYWNCPQNRRSRPRRDPEGDPPHYAYTRGRPLTERIDRGSTVLPGGWKYGGTVGEGYIKYKTDDCNQPSVSVFVDYSFLHTILLTTPVYDWMILTTLEDTFSSI